MRYLITPMQPTPNGRMHIGHAGGTYLRADVLARSLRAQGHQVKVSCGSDGYENWVLAAALDQQCEPLEVASSYDKLIRKDLSFLGIEFSHWTDPLAGDDADRYIAFHRNVLGDLLQRRVLTTKVERVPYSAVSGKPLMGTFIAGECPACGAEVGGSSCTSCSQHFQPSQLRNAHSRLTDEDLVWRDCATWFLQPRDPDGLADRIRLSGAASRHIAVAQSYITRTGGEIRVTGPGDWGIRDPRLPPGVVMHNSYYLFCRYLRSVAVADGSATPDVTVGVFGTDNTTPGLVAPHVYEAVAGPTFEPFDVTIINGMVDLNGQKCSTSRGHGIWLQDLGALATGDEVRLALCGLDLENDRADIDTGTLAERITRYREIVRRRVLSFSGDLDRARVDTGVVRRQQLHLRPETFRPWSASKILTNYLTDACYESDPIRWASTVAELSVAITPALEAFLAAHHEERIRLAPAVIRRGSLAEADLVAIISSNGAAITPHNAQKVTGR